MRAMSDIDIDVKNRNDIIAVMPCTPSSERILDDGTIIQHKSGVHFDNIPTDPTTGIATIPYKVAEELGYQKVDFLNVSAYQHVRDMKHLHELIEQETPWELFKEPEIVGELFQIHSQFSVVSIWPPTNLNQLAMLIAMIRPAKRHLQACNSWAEVESEIWTKDTSGKMGFKRSHSFSYALLISVQLKALMEYLSNP